MNKNHIPALSIGLFGFGVVGESLYHVIAQSRTPDTRIAAICIKHPEKERSISPSLFTSNPHDIIHNPDINLVVELVNEPGEAFHIVKESLLAGKSVVSGNKKMLAEHLPELIQLQEQTGNALLYDASACGSIPVIRNLEEYYDTDLLVTITGILNGSSNYILSRIFDHGDSFPQALGDAQAKGFAEADPYLDISGQDALSKLVILALHGFGTCVSPKDVFHYGIGNLNSQDIRFALERGCRIKQVAQAWKTQSGELALFVMPKLVSPREYIYNVDQEYNGVVIEGRFYEKQFLFGKGAGGYPTGSSVLSDIMARRHNYRYEYKKLRYFSPVKHTNELILEVYFRFNDPQHADLLNFISISERYRGRGTHYLCGEIDLNGLIAARHSLEKEDVFLAFSGIAG